MKRYLPILAALFAACTSSPNKPSKSDSIAAEAATRSDSIPGPACYLLLEGTAKQDSTKLRLEFSGSDVAGELSWIPSMKDARRGTLRGTKSGNMVKGTWTFMQEGVQDTLAVEFQLAGKIVYQRGYRYDQATGRQSLDEKGPFDKEFKRVDCP